MLKAAQYSFSVRALLLVMRRCSWFQQFVLMQTRMRILSTHPPTGMFLSECKNCTCCKCSRKYLTWTNAQYVVTVINTKPWRYSRKRRSHRIRFLNWGTDQFTLFHHCCRRLSSHCWTKTYFDYRCLSRISNPWLTATVHSQQCRRDGHTLAFSTDM